MVMISGGNNLLDTIASENDGELQSLSRRSRSLVESLYLSISRRVEELQFSECNQHKSSNGPRFLSAVVAAAGRRRRRRWQPAARCPVH